MREISCALAQNLRLIVIFAAFSLSNMRKVFTKKNLKGIIC